MNGCEQRFSNMWSSCESGCFLQAQSLVEEGFPGATDAAVLFPFVLFGNFELYSLFIPILYSKTRNRAPHSISMSSWFYIIEYIVFKF